MATSRLAGFPSSAIKNISFEIRQDEPGFKRLRGAVLVPASKDPERQSILYGAIGGVIDQDGHFVNSSAQRRDRDDLCLSIPEGYQLQTPADQGSATGIFGGLIYDHFGHFMLESLSRLWLPLQDRELDQIPIYFLVYGIPLLDYHWETFDILGLRNRVKLIRLPTRVDNLIVPESCFQYPRVAFEKARSVFQKLRTSVEADRLQRPRVYVSRRNLSHGSAMSIPEEKLEDLFRLDGWDIINPEESGVADQIALFRGAKRICGLTGSGMLNVVYADCPEDIVYINRYERPVDTLFLLDKMFSLPSLHVLAHRATDLEPFDAAGPFLLDVNAAHRALVSEGVLSSRTSLRGYRMTDDEDVRRFEIAWHCKRSEVLNSLGRVHEASDEIETALSKAPNVGFLKFQQSLCLYAANDMDGSIQSAMDAIQNGFTTLTAYGFILERLLAARRNSEASRIALDALATYPNNPILLDLLAVATARAGDISSALRYAKQAAKNAPTHPMIRYNLASLLCDADFLDEAQAESKAAVLADPSNPNFRILRLRIMLMIALREAKNSCDLVPSSRDLLLAAVEKFRRELLQSGGLERRLRNRQDAVTSYLRAEAELRHAPEMEPGGPCREELLDRMRAIAESGLFDPCWYAKAYPDSVVGNRNPLQEFASWGAAKGHSPGPDFDSLSYLAKNPDVRNAGYDAVTHYIKYGMAEGRAAVPVLRDGSGVPA